MGEVRAYELQPGDIFTVTPWGLLNMTIEEAEKAAEDDNDFEEEAGTAENAEEKTEE